MEFLQKQDEYHSQYNNVNSSTINLKLVHLISPNKTTGFSQRRYQMRTHIHVWSQCSKFRLVGWFEKFWGMGNEKFSFAAYRGLTFFTLISVPIPHFQSPFPIFSTLNSALVIPHFQTLFPFAFDCLRTKSLKLNSVSSCKTKSSQMLQASPSKN